MSVANTSISYSQRMVKRLGSQSSSQRSMTLLVPIANKPHLKNTKHILNNNMKNNKRPNQQKAVFKLFKMVDELQEKIDSLEDEMGHVKSTQYKLLVVTFSLIVILLTKLIIS